MTLPRLPSPSSTISMLLSACWLPWVWSRSVTTVSASLPQTMVVSRFVESMPLIWLVSIFMNAPSSR